MRGLAGMKMVCAVVWMAGLSCAWAQSWTTVKLNSFAVTNGAGALVVLGTDTNAWTAGMTKEAVYDGNTNTYFDCYQTNNAWAGFQLQSPKIVTRIRYCGRTGQEARMVGARFEGANNAAFSNSVTLWTHTPPAGWLGDSWVDVTLTNAAYQSSCTYLRFIATSSPSFGGNVREVEFYGVDPVTNGLPPKPAMVFCGQRELVYPSTMDSRDQRHGLSGAAQTGRRGRFL